MYHKDTGAFTGIYSAVNSALLHKILQFRLFFAPDLLAGAWVELYQYDKPLQNILKIKDLQSFPLFSRDVFFQTVFMNVTTSGRRSPHPQ